MGVLREDEFEVFLKRRLSSSNGLLIHGSDTSGVAQLGRQVAMQLQAEVQRMDSAACKSSPGSFMDQFLALLLLGDRQILLVEPADDSCMKFLEPILAYDRPANFVLMFAEPLGKASKLRTACESSALCAALALYEEDEAKLHGRLNKILGQAGLVWGEGAEEAFYSTVGEDRVIATREMEKLALYGHGAKQVTANDVAAICGDTAEYDADALIDAVLGGNLEDADRMFTSLGAEARSIFILLQLHVSRLQTLRIDMERGMNADTALRTAKPPIFFKRKSAMMNQLRNLVLEDLMVIQEHIQAATLQARKYASLAEPINARALLTIARLCRTKA